MYLTILDYTNGRTIIINCPVFDNEDDITEKVENYVKENYGKIDFSWIINDNLTIEL